MNSLPQVLVNSFMAMELYYGIFPYEVMVWGEGEKKSKLTGKKALVNIERGGGRRGSGGERREKERRK